MDYKVNVVDKVKQEVDFTLNYEQLTPYFEKAFDKYKKKASIPGFRKGKAPISIIKKMYGDVLEHGSLEDVANDVFRNYLKEKHIHILGEGTITDMDFDAEKTFKFKIKYEVKPEIELTQYKDLEVTKSVREIDEKMIDDEIQYLRSKNATFAEDGQAFDDEYVVTADIQKLDDAGLPIVGESQKGVSFYLNDKNINPDLRKQLKDIKLDEERVLNLQPEEKAKKEKYKAKVTKIEKVVLPELNKEFFTKIVKDEIEDEKSFREKIRTDLTNIYKNISDQELRNNVISELIKANEIPVPDTLVENVLDSYVADLKNRNSKRQIPDDFDETEFRKERKVDAILQVKWYLVRDKIIEAEKMDVTDEDIKPLIEADAKKYNLPEEKIKQVYEKNNDVRYRILDDKLMKFLIDSSKIKEVKLTEEELTEK